MKINVELKELEPQSIVSITETIKVREIPKTFPKLIMEIMKFLNKENNEPIGAPLAIFTDWDNGQGKIEAGFPVRKAIKTTGKIVNGELPSGKAAYVLYKGHIRNIAPVYKIMKEWIMKEGYSYSNIWWEVYLTDPHVEPDMSKWETEVYLLLE